MLRKLAPSSTAHAHGRPRLFQLGDGDAALAGDREDAGFAGPSRPEQIVGVGQADVATIVVREVQVVSSERPIEPVRGADVRRSVDVVGHAAVRVRADDRLVGQRSSFINTSDPARGDSMTNSEQLNGDGQRSMR